MSGVSNSGGLTRWALLAAALTLLNVSVTFVNIWPTLAVRSSRLLSLEAALLVLGVALARGWRGRALSNRALRVLGILWVVLVLGRYIDVTARSLYGRSVNLFWDFKLLPDVGAMFAFVAHPLVLAGLAAAVVLIPVLLYLPLRWAIRHVCDASAEPDVRRALVVMTALVVGLCGVQRLDSRLVPGLRFAPPVLRAYAQEGVELFREATGLAHRPLPPEPRLQSDLSRVQGADVLVLFIESYGATSWDRPEFVSALTTPRRHLAEALRETGRQVVSGYVDSTTFGGESWLAHISLLSGSEVRDPDINMRLMTQSRDTLVKLFSRGGYTTAMVMPGVRTAWPEGGFYGFDRIYSAPDMGYRGPMFGWWDVTDQYVMARMDELVLAPQPRKPAFVVMPTITTHAPFNPVPPYQTDWARVLTDAPYDQAALDASWAQPADWTDLGPGYAASMAYVYQWLGGYLRLRADRDLVLVILGDHQPPALVSGEGASWEVPVHVVASRPALLARLRQRGFRDGLTPGRPALAQMHTLTPILLDAFGESGGETE